jgi:hypothetical protein
MGNRGPDNAALAGASALLATVGVDLSSKAIAVAASPHGTVVFNRSRPDDLARRIAMSLLAVAVMYGLALGARHLGIGRLWGGWIGTGLLVGGVLGNGLSWWIWEGGIPDFIRPGGDHVWNLADFAIGLGVCGAILSIAVSALIAYLRERFRFAPAQPPSVDSAG